VVSNNDLCLTPVHKSVEAISTTLDPADRVCLRQFPVGLIPDVLNSFVRIEVSASFVDARYLKTAHAHTPLSELTYGHSMA
jgi:hypothetical protein